MTEAESVYFLEHHGVKGQRWGVIRTPAQLGHKVKKRKEKLRKKVLASSNSKFVHRHRDLLDSRELQDRIDRIAKETKIKELATPKKKKLYKKADDFLKKTASMADSVAKAYKGYEVVSGKKNKDKDKDKDKDKEYISRKGKKRVSKAVNDIMNDPGFKAIMGVSAALNQADKEERKKNRFGLSNSLR